MTIQYFINSFASHFVVFRSYSLAIRICGHDKEKLTEGFEMAIASVVEKNGNVYIYGEKGGILGVVPAGTQTGDGLKGYTGSTVSVQRGMYVHVYNERGSLINTIAGRR